MIQSCPEKIMIPLHRVRAAKTGRRLPPSPAELEVTISPPSAMPRRDRLMPADARPDKCAFRPRTRRCVHGWCGPYCSAAGWYSLSGLAHFVESDGLAYRKE